jgi:alkylation response protein AidB-like acyl-CoA dehydrogenase
MVLHFSVPMNSPHVKILDTWHALGMRRTGSHDVLIEGHVVPETAVSTSEPSTLPVFGFTRCAWARARHVTCTSGSSAAWTLS